jgi:hypothetical protein
LRFLRGSKDDYLTLSADTLHNVRWWVDASYAIHPDMKSHTGGALSLGVGVLYGTSKRQKLNTKSSTEAEVVGTDDVMPQILWTLYFLEAQGYKIDDNVLYQDNKSSILLETNGRGSSGKRTRHINVRYFFIADRVKSKEIRIEYCPTGIMLADYFTKPLQGVLFRQLRDMIMGNTHVAIPSERIPPAPPLKESRSVLEMDNETVKPPGFPTVPSAYIDTRANKSQSRIHSLVTLPDYNGANGKTVIHPYLSHSDQTSGQRKVSWADVVKRRKE